MFSAALILSSQQLSLAVPWLLLKVCFFYFSAISCSVLRAPEHGELNCSHLHENFTFGSTCDFSCQPGFELLGSQSRECTATRTWTRESPPCKGRAAGKRAICLEFTLGCSWASHPKDEASQFPGSYFRCASFPFQPSAAHCSVLQSTES